MQTSKLPARGGQNFFHLLFELLFVILLFDF